MGNFFGLSVRQFLGKRAPNMLRLTSPELGFIGVPPSTRERDATVFTIHTSLTAMKKQKVLRTNRPC